MNVKKRVCFKRVCHERTKQTLLKKPFTKRIVLFKEVIARRKVRRERFDACALAADGDAVGRGRAGGEVEGGADDDEDAVEVRHEGGDVDGVVLVDGVLVDEDADVVADVALALDALRVVGLEGQQRRDVEGQLARFVQQQYLARQYTKRAQPAGAAAAGEGAGSTAEYVVGPRTLAEYSRVDVLRFVAAVLGQTLTQSMAEDVLVSQQDLASISAAFAAETRAETATQEGEGDDDDDDFLPQGPPAQRPRHAS